MQPGLVSRLESTLRSPESKKAGILPAFRYPTPDEAGVEFASFVQFCDAASFWTSSMASPTRLVITPKASLFAFRIISLSSFTLVSVD